MLADKLDQALELLNTTLTRIKSDPNQVKQINTSRLDVPSKNICRYKVQGKLGCAHQI
jgi:hypothetical protein